MKASQTLLLDRERIRDGARRGEPTAAFVLIIEDDKGPRAVWRGFSRAAAIEAARAWIERGARFVDKTVEALAE
jgi:hypothetical protein